MSAGLSQAQRYYIERRRQKQRLGIIPWSGSGGPPSVVLDPVAAAVVARMSAAPSQATQKAMSDLTSTLVSAGIWAKAALFAIFAQDNQQGALLNWATAHPALATGAYTPGTGTFTAGKGFLGDGANSQIDWGAGYEVLPANAFQDMTHLVWSLTNVTINRQDGGPSLIVGRTGTTMSIGANQTPNFAVTTADSLGLYGWTRRGAAGSGGSVAEAWKNGAKLGSQAAATDSLIASAHFMSLRGNTSVSPTTRQIAADLVFTPSLTDAEQATVYSAVRAYMQAVAGAP